MLAALALSYWVVSKEAIVSHNDLFKHQQRDILSPIPQSPTTAEGAGLWTVIFAYYCLFIHVLVAAFPLRSCWAMWDLTRSLKRAAHSKALQSLKFAHRRRGSSTSLSSSETLTSSHGSSASSEAGDLEPELYTDGDAEPDSVIHAIVIPNYKEELDTLRETLEVLGCHPQARNSYDVSAELPERYLHHSRVAICSLWSRYHAIEIAIPLSNFPNTHPLGCYLYEREQHQADSLKHRFTWPWNLVRTTWS